MHPHLTDRQGRGVRLDLGVAPVDAGAGRGDVAGDVELRAAGAERGGVED